MKYLKIWTNRKQILEGVTNSLFKKEHVEFIAQERMDICNECEFIDRTGSECLIPGTSPCCSVCGCKLAWKTRALSEGCDKGKWEALLSEEEENEVNKKLDL